MHYLSACGGGHTLLARNFHEVANICAPTPCDIQHFFACFKTYEFKFDLMPIQKVLINQWVSPEGVNTSNF
jgi:hypothetical protein